ncbi:cytochrome P450 [Allokutzneria sp. A3M-2-11 16]|uniref:cytochrome P450 n=1 Tax=Allokutzneria sp. A3M-2-11 16 TaxID=2962043 RepID=UPI0020B6C2C5|nr:cytochrome P450 [Allokutzneria sp. A3M-2-11 16]MCP3805196.1 cytochrome P450 [Allokutzneria sp. A3M-2-11 16]
MTATRGAFPVDRDPARPLDPAPGYRELGERAAPVSCPMGVEARVFTRHSDIRAALADRRLSSRGAPSNHVVPGADPDEPVSPGVLLRLDGPEHARLRKLLIPEFTVRRIEALRPAIARLVDEHIDAMLASTEPVDLYRNFALPIPSLVICELLGVPYADRDSFQHQSTLLVGVGGDPGATAVAAMEVQQFMAQLVLSKMERPTDDLLGRLIRRAAETGQPLTVEELVSLGVTLLVAGHETTANMIALSTLALLRSPDQLAALRSDPAIAPSAAEELLRYLSIVHFGLFRYATEDVEIGDETVRAGEWLVAALSAGNREESVFPDPDRLDLTRNARAHLAFGHGVHQCLGQQLARVELQEVFTRLYSRLPGLRLAVPFEEIRFKHDALVYGVRSLPAAWD